MTEEVERDVLYVLFHTRSPMRFTAILNELTSQSMYRGKEESLKITLWRILRRFQTNDLVQKEKISHKNVQYSIKDRRKARLRLDPETNRLEKTFTQVQRNIHNRNVEDLASSFLLSYLLNLVDYERLMCKALAQMDEESFRFFRRHGRTDMLLLWDVFTDLLWEKRKEGKIFYEAKLCELEDPDMENGYVARTKSGWIISPKAYRRYTQALTHVEVKHAELVVSIIQNVLNTCANHLDVMKQTESDPKLERESVTNFLKKAARPLTYEELKTLRELTGKR